MRVPLLCLGIACLALAGCATPGQRYATDAEMAASHYREPGPNTLTLITMVSNRTGNGAHSALLINAPGERVMFDPAGSFVLDGVPERNDVLYGITPQELAYYKSAHARSTFHVVLQTVEVTPEQAQTALQLAQREGHVAALFCANSTSGVLRRVPGFGQIKQVMQPNALMNQFAQIPGVTTEKYFEDDEGNIQDGVAAVNAQKAAAEAAKAAQPFTN
ncbi:hypothetical protein [Chachezhania sediminis]|uniref:hypothetical protein n=1 Tax=Chachezhania sediminis TaxID=2599291 RepID=UPI00131C656F|nr:hypothetical protein [Chachezhania sediminis]